MEIIQNYGEILQFAMGSNRIMKIESAKGREIYNRINRITFSKMEEQVMQKV